MATDTRKALWRERIDHWRESGLTQRAFAQQHGVHARQIRYWIARFAKIDEVPQLIPVSIKRGNLASVGIMTTPAAMDESTFLVFLTALIQNKRDITTLG